MFYFVFLHKYIQKIDIYRRLNEQDDNNEERYLQIYIHIFLQILHLMAAVVQRWSGQPLIRILHVQFPPYPPVSQSDFRQSTEPHMVVTGWRRWSAAELPAVCDCVCVNGSKRL